MENYPKHIYEPIRYEVAENYLVHELRKLFESVGNKYPEDLENDVRNLKTSKELNNPRDFWNGFHGLAMGYKLKIGLIYAITSKNISWKKEKISFNEVYFGVEQELTTEIRPGKLLAREVAEYYMDSANLDLRNTYLEKLENIFGDLPGMNDPIIVFQMSTGDYKGKLLTNDGNRRLSLSVCRGNVDSIDAYVGRFTDEDYSFRNPWIPTPILMDILCFCRIAYDKGDRVMFKKYMEVLADMVSESDCGKYELINRSISSQEPFRSDVLSGLRELGVS